MGEAEGIIADACRPLVQDPTRMYQNEAFLWTAAL